MRLCQAVGVGFLVWSHQEHSIAALQMLTTV